MNHRRVLSIAIFASIILCLIASPCGVACFTAYAQQSADQPGASAPTIRAESRLVLIDTVVTDKKGNYVTDLTAKDFRVWEDDQEQKINTFSFEQTATGDASQKQHLVLFFDDDNMQPRDQSRARLAAARFLEKNSGPGRFVAIIDYAGTMKIAQNFTDDAARLQRVVATPTLSTSISDPASAEATAFATYDSFSNRSVLLALRSVARSLASIPGRKNLVWLTEGFPLTPDNQAEMTALINECNKDNVAVYPLDVRGITVFSMLENNPWRPTLDSDLEPVPFPSGPSSGDISSAIPHLVYVAQTKTGGGSTGTHAGGSTGTTGTRPVVPQQGAMNLPRNIIPPSPYPPSASLNQQVLYSIAVGTGGFVISNNNDIFGGLEKVGKEQTEYYILGYVPPAGPDGACHTLRVKVDRSGTVVRARSGYCTTKPVDLLAGRPEARKLEEHAMGNQRGSISGFVSAPCFYTSPETARVNLAMEIPGKSFEFEKAKGKQHSVLNVLGMAMKPDGTVAARFSDTVELDLEKHDLEEFSSRPYHYENQFYIAGGQYTLKLAVSSGEKYGQFEVPLVVDHYDPAKFSMSDLALSRQFYKIADPSTSLDALLLQDRTPLVTQGLQLVPSGSNSFKKSDQVAIYLEVYEPASVTSPKIGLRMRILDKKTGESRLEASVPDTASSVIPGNPVVPMGVPLPVNQLQPGTYVVELRATEASGKATNARKAEFSIE